MSENIDDISDGYHTFSELYDHRAALFIHVMVCHRSRAWFTRRHDDGTEIEGFFLAGIDLPEIGQVTYHLRIDPWEDYLRCLSLIAEYDRAPRWDGHTPADVFDRLTAYWPARLGMTMKESPH